MKLKFTKMHGCGNDYIYFNCFEQQVADPEALSIRLSDRHFGIGGDGIVLICPSDVADAKMRMFNADGSEGKMCGNATRCIGKYMYEHGLISKPEMTLETLSGIKILKMTEQDGKIASVRVDMGKAHPQAVGNPDPIRGRHRRIRSAHRRRHGVRSHLRFDGQPALHRFRGSGRQHA